MATTLQNTLRELGIPRTYCGYKLTIAAVELGLQDEDRLLSVTKEIYWAVADQCGCDRSHVERNIRTIIMRAWSVNRPLLLDIAGYPLEAPPSVSEFIDMLVSYLQRNAA